MWVGYERSRFDASQQFIIDPFISRHGTISFTLIAHGPLLVLDGVNSTWSCNLGSYLSGRSEQWKKKSPLGA
jgi:hypothetical protein